MLNRVILMGRITHELEVKQTSSGISALTFSIAVDRNYKNQNGEYDTDFISCVAWRQTAEFIAKFFGKGKMIAVEGQLRPRTYDDKNGVKHYVTEVYVDSASFTGEKKDAQSGFSNGASNYSEYGGTGSQGASSSAQRGNTGGFIAGTEQAPNAKGRANDNQVTLGDLSEFEDIDVINDGGVPF